MVVKVNISVWLLRSLNVELENQIDCNILQAIHIPEWKEKK